METPVIARLKGYYHEMEVGQRYLWCSCGRSQTQPFCDGSHAGTGLLPLRYRALQAQDVIFCGCKHTGTPPFCDGAHNNLDGASPADDPDSAANRAVKLVDSDGPVRQLDGPCFVVSPAFAARREQEGMRYAPLVTPGRGAQFQSQFLCELPPGLSPIISVDSRETVLFLLDDAAEIEIAGRHFTAARHSGIYIKPGEAYRVYNRSPNPVKLLVSNAPGGEDLVFLDTMPMTFDAGAPHRVAAIDADQRNGMGDRFYQLLINQEHGSHVVTQFIGNIPLSKGEPHRHLYEETLIFLHGEGVVWTEHSKTRVRAGDILFLPRKQLHSVQCTSARGLDVVGIIYPGDNPSISY